MTANTHASAVTSRRAVQMASEKEKENVLVVSRAENTKAQKAEKDLEKAGYIIRR